ncbi:MAG TPA: hypothetical protein ENH01_06870 [Nitrospirae bacterium]|nr:hypothetical protein [Nitrospirota bacterium]HDZ62736.1 hypothetical protein [Nitrospirota bacterium]
MHTAKIKLILILLVGVSLVSCSTIHPAGVYSRDFLNDINSVYVVQNKASKRGIDIYIQKALAVRGIRASIGPIESKPKNVDAYVTFSDIWRWDMSMYLDKLDINIYDNHTNELVATGEFDNSWLHSFPDPRKKVFQVIDSIWTKLP